MRAKLLGALIVGLVITIPAMFISCGGDDETESDGGTGGEGDTGGPADTGGPVDSGATPDAGGTTDAGWLATGQFTAKAVDFFTKSPIKGAQIDVLDDATGEPTGMTTTSLEDGTFAFDGLPDAAVNIGVRATMTDYMPTVQYHFPKDAQHVTVNVVSNSTVGIISALLGVEVDPAKGSVAGGVFWGDLTGYEGIGCAMVTTEPASGAIHYTDNSGYPTKDRDALGTNKKDGIFTIINVDAGAGVEITATLDTVSGTTTLPKVHAGSLSIANIWFDKTTYPANPTPAACE
ncbi:MAG: hypothetical protein HY897_03210 [Deltaproteobacteria bacterium]|nr:hypothetical protein [Deltaproteobacteria bacterium]